MICRSRFLHDYFCAPLLFVFAVLHCYCCCWCWSYSGWAQASPPATQIGDRLVNSIEVWKEHSLFYRNRLEKNWPNSFITIHRFNLQHYKANLSLEHLNHSPIRYILCYIPLTHNFFPNWNGCRRSLINHKSTIIHFWSTLSQSSALRRNYTLSPLVTNIYWEGEKEEEVLMRQIHQLCRHVTRSRHRPSEER